MNDIEVIKERYFIVNIKFNHKESRKNSPMEILKKRFASGEISREEYEERKNILEKN